MFGEMFATSVPLLLLLCLGPVLAEHRSFTALDPRSNRLLECRSCPPGTFLVSRCSAGQETRCAPCPEGTFTEIWNSIEKCRRCRSCHGNQQVETVCRADSNARCRCADGFYLEQSTDACVPLSKCPTGEGVLRAGTQVSDTECQPCPAGTFSNRNSAQQECVQHRRCQATAGLQRLLPGTSWHDTICVKCDANRTEAAVEHLRGVLPVFFTHHRLPQRLLRRVYHRMRSSPGTRDSSAHLSSLNLQEKVGSWLSSAASSQLQELPAMLREAGAGQAAGRLQKKLQHVQQNLNSVCGAQ